MGNGFPVGGIFIHPSVEASFGLLGTTLRESPVPAAALTVLEVIEDENPGRKMRTTCAYFVEKHRKITELKRVKGRGLMPDWSLISDCRFVVRNFIMEHHIFLRAMQKNLNVIRILHLLNPLKEIL
jgi:acetylornithine aminotransferase